MIRFEQKGDFSKLEKFLYKLKKKKFFDALEKYAALGVEALAAATPKDTGKTAASWSSEVFYSSDMVRITWSNSNFNKGVPIAIILQYGHGTGTGGYVAGRDYINPAMKPIFDEISEKVWKEVTSL